uniref:DEP domain-containing protein n=1 Tax=Macrostomum lignano TaxID=282301 RepID=A0A1I8F4X6_9PLAT
MAAHHPAGHSGRGGQRQFRQQAWQRRGRPLCQLAAAEHPAPALRASTVPSNRLIEWPRYPVSTIGIAASALVGRVAAHHHSKQQQPTYESAGSMMSSDLDSTSFLDSEDDIESSRNGIIGTKNGHPHISRTSSFSSVTESAVSLDVRTVELDMDAVQFLGISIVGHPAANGGSGGIYVGSIMRGGRRGTRRQHPAGRHAAREAGQNSSLVVAKCWDSRDYQLRTMPREEPVRPIDPRAWGAAHQRYATGPGQRQRRHWHAWRLSADRTGRFLSGWPCLIMLLIAGLTVTGSDLVDWLYTRVEGFTERKEARKWAAEMLRQGCIRHKVNKVGFSEQCYYVFGDCAVGGVSAAADVHPPPPPALPVDMSKLNVGGGFDSGGSGRQQLPQPQMPPINWAPPGPPPSYTDRADSVSQYSSLQAKTPTPLGAMPPVNSAAVGSDN